MPAQHYYKCADCTFESAVAKDVQDHIENNQAHFVQDGYKYAENAA